MNSAQFEIIWLEARTAANKAGNECKPTPVVFAMAAGITGNAIVPGTEEVCEEGVCGFAWLKTGGRSSFARFVKQYGYGRKGVYGGIHIPSSSLYDYFGQSLERKEAAMEAAAKVFQKYGLKVFAQSRMD